MKYNNNEFYIVENKLVSYLGKKDIVIIPEGVEEISSNAFVNNDKVQAIIIPKTVRRINDNGIYNVNLVDIQVDEKNQYYYAEDSVLYTKDKSELIIYPNEKICKEFIMPKQVKKICKNAFQKNKYLETIHINSNLQSIENDSLGELPKLIKINVDSSNNNFQVIDNVLYNKDTTKLIKFPPRHFQTELKVPKQVIEISEKACFGCKFIEKIIFNDNIKEIKEKAFSNCINLTSVLFPQTKIIFHDYSFANCQNLEKLNLNNTNFSINAKAFFNTNIQINNNNYIIKNSKNQIKQKNESKEYNKFIVNSIVFIVGLLAIIIGIILNFTLDRDNKKNLIEQSSEAFYVDYQNYNIYKECLPYKIDDNTIENMKYNDYSNVISPTYNLGMSQMDFKQSGDIQRHYQLMDGNRVAELVFKSNGNNVHKRFKLIGIYIHPIKFIKY